MIDRLVALALSNRAVVLFTTLLVLVGGYLSFRSLTIEAFPDPTDTQVNIITLYPGQPAEEMERQVSIPIERAVNGTAGLAKVRSLNLFGLSFITLTFSDGIDVLFARSQTLERLRLAELPVGVTPQLGSLSTPIGEVYRYSLTTVPVGQDPGNPESVTKRDPMLLRTLQDYVVRPRLLQVDGVGRCRGGGIGPGGGVGDPDAGPPAAADLAPFTPSTLCRKPSEALAADMVAAGSLDARGVAAAKANVRDDVTQQLVSDFAVFGAVLVPVDGALRGINVSYRLNEAWQEALIAAGRINGALPVEAPSEAASEPSA